MERVSSFKYLGVNISEDLTLTTHIQTQVKAGLQSSTESRALSPLCRTSTSNAAKAELLKSSKTQITPVTVFSFYKHLASASGA